MGKVKETFTRHFVDPTNNEVFRVHVSWDCNDENTEEGYGVVIGNDTTDNTIAFGQGHLSYRLSHMFYTSVCHELMQHPTDELPSDFVFDFDIVESLYNSEEDDLLVSEDEVIALSRAVRHIVLWCIFPSDFNHNEYLENQLRLGKAFDEQQAYHSIEK